MEKKRGRIFNTVDCNYSCLQRRFPGFVCFGDGVTQSEKHQRGSSEISKQFPFIAMVEIFSPLENGTS